MKDQSSAQHQMKRARVTDEAPSTSMEGGMDEETPSDSMTPRELTQNPLKKIWMPYKNGLPETHISQRKGAYVTLSRRGENETAK